IPAPSSSSGTSNSCFVRGLSWRFYGERSEGGPPRRRAPRQGPCALPRQHTSAHWLLTCAAARTRPRQPASGVRGPTETACTGRAPAFVGARSRAFAHFPIIQSKPMGSILVVDDDPAAAKLLELALARQGHQVEVARDVSSGKQAVRAGHHDLMILDVFMPD